MIDFVLGMFSALPIGLFLGYLFNKYRTDKSELFENINLIKEDLANLQVQFSTYINKL